MGGVVGFNYLAWEFVAKRLKIEIDLAMLEKIRTIEQSYVACVSYQPDEKKHK